MTDIIREIATKTRVKLVEYELDKLLPYLQKYHASTLRWTMMHDYFEVMHSNFQLLIHSFDLIRVRA